MNGLRPDSDIDILIIIEMSKMILLWQARKNSKTLPGLVSCFKGDERNVLLTLSRMWFALETEEITTKNIAEKWVISKLPERFSPLLAMAKEAYLGNLSDEWETIENET